MTDLTEQWKKGELLTGWYYIKAIDRFTFPFGIALIIGKEIITTFPHLLDDEIEQILAPVPSYEEWQAKLEENTKLKERIYEFAEANQSLRKQLDGEKAKNRIDYYDGSPVDFLDECERDRKKNKIYKNLINNIREELIISDLRRTNEGNKFIVGILYKINQALGEDK